MNTTSVWVVVSSMEDDCGDPYDLDPQRCFASRELAETVARLDGGEVREWVPQSVLPNTRRWVRRDVQFDLSDGSLIKDSGLRVWETVYDHPTRTWRGVHVSDTLGPHQGWVTIQMWCEYTTDNFVWFQDKLNLARDNFAGLVAEGTHYDRFD